MQVTKIDATINRELEYDAMAEIEKMLGKHHHEFTSEERSLFLGHAFAMNQLKKQRLMELGDTHFDMFWDEFISIIKTYGFQEGLRYDIQHDDTYVDEAILYYHKEKGLIIWATSYLNKKVVNGGKLYGEIQVKADIEPSNAYLQTLSYALSRCSHAPLNEIQMGVHFSYDIREGLINTIERINQVVPFNSIWKQKQFLWFLDYQEEKGNHDYEAINKEKINQSAIELQNIVAVYMEE